MRGSQAATGGVLDLYHDAAYEDERRGEGAIEDYCDVLMAKDHLQAHSAEVRDATRNRPRYFMTFDEHLSYAGFSIMLFQKRLQPDRIGGRRRSVPHRLPRRQLGGGSDNAGDAPLSKRASSTARSRNLLAGAETTCSRGGARVEVRRCSVGLTSSQMLDALTGGVAPSVRQRESSMDDIEQTQHIPASSSSPTWRYLSPSDPGPRTG